MVNQTKVTGIFYDKCEVKQMILEACSTGKMFTGSAGRKERSWPKWHQEKEQKSGCVNILFILRIEICSQSWIVNQLFLYG